MLVVSFFRLIKYAFQDLGRNISLAFMTVFILTLMLLSINTLWSIDVITKEAIGAVKQQIDVSVYFLPSATDQQVGEIQTYVKKFPEVVGLDLQSRDEVLQTFKDQNQSQTEVLDALNELGTNPFGSTLIIKTRDPGDYTKIINALSVPEYKDVIESTSFDKHEEAIGKLQSIITRIEEVGMGLTAMFALISFLIIFNTIRVAINTQRVEISIKRLVGASNWFIRGPYLMESVLFTILSVGLTIGLVFLGLKYLDPYLAEVMPNGFLLTNCFKSNILMLFGFQALAVLILTVLSSGLAMRKQLKV